MVSDTIRMDLDLSGQALAIQCRPNESLRQFIGSPSPDLNKLVLLDNICHLLLLLLPLVGLFLELGDLLHQAIETMAIR